MNRFRKLSRRLPSPRPPRGRSGGRRGFTLIEIIIVLAIMGILASIAVYTYRMMIDKARMTQAKTVLDHLAKMEATYFSDNDRYTDSISLLDYDPVKYNYYEVSVVLLDNGMNYRGTAKGVGIMDNDLWTITKDGQPVQDNSSRFR